MALDPDDPYGENTPGDLYSPDAPADQSDASFVIDEGYSFVKTRHLSAYMSGLGLDNEQADTLQDVLDGLQRQLERHCQRRFELTERTERAVVGDGGLAWVKGVPVHSVSAPDGAVADGNLVRLGMGVYPRAVMVTYVGGLDPDDDNLQDVKVAILRAAAREATTRHDDVLDPNDLTARRVSPADRRMDPGFTKGELEQFDRLRRRTVM